MKDARVELRIHGQRAALVRLGDSDTGHFAVGFVDPAAAGLGDELTAALHEWARVAAAFYGGGRVVQDTTIAGMVSRRGKQLATRVAETMGTPVRYHDPVAGAPVTVRPTTRWNAGPAAESLIGTSDHPVAAVPWLTGLTLALFSSVLLVVAMLALTTAIAENVAGWLALVAAVAVTAGLIPSLWLARGQPILRWVALGVAVGLVCSWIGTAVLVS